MFLFHNDIGIEYKRELVRAVFTWVSHHHIRRHHHRRHGAMSLGGKKKKIIIFITVRDSNSHLSLCHYSPLLNSSKGLCSTPPLAVVTLLFNVTGPSCS